MYRLRPFFKEYETTGALHTLVAVDTVVDECVFATKPGDLAVFVRLAGIDPECVEPAQLDSLVRRLETAHKVFDERFRVCQYRFQREHPGLNGERYANPLADKAVQNRLRFLNGSTERLFVIDTVLVIVYEGWRDGAHQHAPAAGLITSLSRAFSTSRTEAELSAQLALARELLLGKVQTFATQLREFFSVELLNKEQAFQIQRRLLNYAPLKSEYARLTGNHFVDYQSCGSALECHRDYLRLDDEYVAVLTLKEPPPQTYAFMLMNLESLDCPFILATEWQRWDTARVRRLIQSKRRHFHNSKSSLSSQLSSHPAGTPADVLIDTAAVATVGILGACLNEIEVHRRHFGEYSLTLILHEKDLTALRRAVAQAVKAFAVHDAQLTEERYNRLNAWLAPLPGNSAFNLRRMLITDTNQADLSLLFAPATGDIRNKHLNREYLAVFEGRGNSPYYFNLQFEDVGHTFISGATGSGKSFFLNFLLTHLLKYDPLIRVFDLGGSYRNLTRLAGGSSMTVCSEERPFTINPFCLPPTRENLQFLFAWVRVLIGKPLTADEEQDLFEQIENLYHVAPTERRLSTLANIVHRNLRKSLQRWIQGGPYGSLFDNAEDTLTMSSFQTFDFQGMDDAKDVLEVLLFYILHRANAAIEEDPARLKVFVMDEAWRFFAHPVIKNYMIEALKTWRKRNACLILATQSAGDLTGSAMLPIVMESCPTQIFLANPRMDRERYRESFHLNDRELELIATLVPKREFLLKRPDHSKVLRLEVDRKEYWIYTNNAADNARRDEAFSRYGFEAGLEHLAKEKP